MFTRVEPAVHGALDFAELERLGIQPDEVLDFSVNSNPFGPSPAVRAAIAAAPLDPGREWNCRAHLAGRFCQPCSRRSSPDSWADLWRI